MNQKLTKKKRRYQKGGLLVMNPELDLINTHLCLSKKEHKDTAGQEVYTYNGEIYQLNESTLGFLQQQFKKKQWKMV